MLPIAVFGGLLFGGLLCLALAAPLEARADAPRQQDSPEALVQKLEEALRAGDERAVAAVLADTPDNRTAPHLIHAHCQPDRRR